MVGTCLLLRCAQQLPVAVEAAALAEGLIDPSEQPMFEVDVPNPLDPDYLYYPHVTSNGYESFATVMACSSDSHETGLVASDGTSPLKTSIYRYQSEGGDCLWPGKTFEVRAYTSLYVKWENNIDSTGGYVLKSMGGESVVDTSLHWAYGLPGYEDNDVESNVPVITHVHGSHTVCHADGNPEAFFGRDYEPFGPLAQSLWNPYENRQEAAALWYHDHTLGITVRFE